MVQLFRIYFVKDALKRLEGETELCLYLRAKKQIIIQYAKSALILISLALTIYIHKKLTHTHSPCTFADNIIQVTVSVSTNTVQYLCQL